MGGLSADVSLEAYIRFIEDQQDILPRLGTGEVNERDDGVSCLPRHQQRQSRDR